MIKRYFIPHAINAVRECLKDLPPNKAALTFVYTPEYGIFGNHSLALREEYDEQLEQLMLSKTVMSSGTD